LADANWRVGELVSWRLEFIKLPGRQLTKFEKQ
jgi:hypothetical protein